MEISNKLFSQIKKFIRNNFLSRQNPYTITIVMDFICLLLPEDYLLSVGWQSQLE